jgi:hypothetical protein
VDASSPSFNRSYLRRACRCHPRALSQPLLPVPESRSSIGHIFTFLQLSSTPVAHVHCHPPASTLPCLRKKVKKLKFCSNLYWKKLVCVLKKEGQKIKFCSNVYIKKAKHIISCAFAQPNTEWRDWGRRWECWNFAQMYIEKARVRGQERRSKN